MTQIHAYLTFNGNCREAMTFYQGCFGGELTLQAVEGTPMEQQCPAGMKHHIMHSMLKKDGLVLFATDMVSPAGFIPGTTMSLSLDCSTEEELRTYFTYLSSEGQVIEALTDRFWGAVFGCVKDKYGIVWLFNFDKQEQKN